MTIIFYISFIVLFLGVIFVLRQLFIIRQNQARLDWLEEQSYSIVRIDVPRNNEKAPLAAEQMFASLHGIYSDSAAYQNHMSFEIVARDKYIQFYVFVPTHLKDFIEGQIYAQYPNVEIHDVPDYTTQIEEANFAGCELLMTKEDVYPIKLFSDFEVDPISGITSVMSKLANGEQVWLQIIIRPVGDEWQEKGNATINAVRSGKSGGAKGSLKSIFSGISKFSKLVFLQAVKPGAEVAEPESGNKELPGQVEDALKGIEMKIMKLGFATKIRIMTTSSDPVSARVKTQSVAAAFKQYNTTNLNGFRGGEISLNNHNFWKEFCSRTFEDDGNILNIGELASIFHFPHKSVETPNIVWSGSKKGEPPANLPLKDNTPDDDLTVIGETTYRNVFKLFGIKRDDRRRHSYIIGKSGVGKSVLMENMAIDDIVEGRGVIIVDPHGEFAEKALSCVPDSRINDVVVFDPSDRSYPIAFNLLEHVDDDFKGMVASGFVGIFKKIFGDSWGPRLEHILRNTVLALLDYPESTMLDIPRMLTENRFRDKVVMHVKDSVIKEFWEMEFAQYDNKFRTEAVSPILNKVGQFLSTATIRNIVGQPHSTLNIREIMDQEKIMIVNLSRGKIGEDNSALLGAMMITKIQLAAMSRADVTVDKRADSYLYVDEFQNFATESFAVILSEARKYHLNLTIANQYISQMPEEVRDAVFGNAGTIICFRVGGTDAEFLIKEFEPVFDANDLVNLDKYNIYIKLLIDGVSSPAFSAQTLPPVDKISGNSEKIISASREKYSKNRAWVEQKIREKSLLEQEELKAEAEAYKSGGLEAMLLKRKEPIVNSDSGSSAIQNERPKIPDLPLKNIQEESKPAESDSKFNSVKPDIEEKVAEKKEPRLIRFQNIIGNNIYKEQTAKGGVKWYIGEKIDLSKLEDSGYKIDEKSKKMIELAKKASRESTNSQANNSDLAEKVTTKEPETRKEEDTNFDEDKDSKAEHDENSNSQNANDLEEGKSIDL